MKLKRLIIFLFIAGVPAWVGTKVYQHLKHGYPKPFAIYWSGEAPEA